MVLFMVGEWVGTMSFWLHDFGPKNYRRMVNWGVPECQFPHRAPVVTRPGKHSQFANLKMAIYS